MRTKDPMRTQEIMQTLNPMKTQDAIEDSRPYADLGPQEEPEPCKVPVAYDDTGPYEDPKEEEDLMRTQYLVLIYQILLNFNLTSYIRVVSFSIKHFLLLTSDEFKT